jgi:ornithine cyclodeaminase
MRLLSAQEIALLLPISRAIPLMREAFLMISAGSASVADRQALEFDAGTGLLMGAAHSARGVAAKLVSVIPSNRKKGLPGSVGLLLLMDPGDGSPLALLDGTQLTAIRTAALNACAIDLLARRDASIALLVGCGTQAAAQLSGLQAVRDLEQIRVLGTSETQAAEFVDRNTRGGGAPLSAVRDLRSALQGVDIIVSATNSPDPVIPGDLVPSGCHVSGVGSYKKEMCEFDNEMISKSSIFVECRRTANREAGELMAAVDAGASVVSDWTELGEVLKKSHPGRRNDREITFFKSVGHAIFDLLAARDVWETAADRQMGTQWKP